MTYSLCSSSVVSWATASSPSLDRPPDSTRRRAVTCRKMYIVQNTEYELNATHNTFLLSLCGKGLGAERRHYMVAAQQVTSEATRDKRERETETERKREREG